MIDPRRPLVVMYHYVWPETPPEPSGVRPLLTREFEAQLDALSERYDICHADEFLKRRNETSDRPPCLLTFDDGTIDHATIVTPILARRGLSGVFFVLSGPAEEGLMPLTHAVHWALSVGDEVVWSAIDKAARDANVSVGEEPAALAMYHYEPPLRAKIKYATNVALPNEVTSAAIESLAASRGTSVRDLARRWFVSANDVKAMQAAGMTIGVHCRTHRSLQQMGDGVGEEMRTCADFIRRATGESPTWFACPFGGTGAAPDLHANMHATMDELGLLAGVSTSARSVAMGDDSRALPRIDCIALPPRKPWA